MPDIDQVQHTPLPGFLPGIFLYVFSLSLHKVKAMSTNLTEY